MRVLLICLVMDLRHLIISHLVDMLIFMMESLH